MFKLSAIGLLAIAACFILVTPNAVQAQPVVTEYLGNRIPTKIETLYVKGINYLKDIQTDKGSFGSARYGNQSGVVGMGVLAMLAHGEDPNFGPYSKNISGGIDYIITNARPSNGYLGESMYNHGFATLALAEAYGTVDNDKIGPALQKAVDMLLTSQENNPRGGWRYSPESSDADSTVSGAQLMALLAARNAGIEIPDKAIERGLQYMKSCQDSSGGIGYTRSGGGNSPRTAIATTVYGIAHKKDTPEFKSAFRFLKQSGYSMSSYPYYNLYYSSQAYFHASTLESGMMKEWAVWNDQNVRQLELSQLPDGNWDGSHGPVFSTSAALLSLALNYRLLPIYER